LIARFFLGAAFCWQAILTLLSASTAAALDLPFTLSKPAGDGPFPAVLHEIVVYPGVHHSFDSPARLLFLPERRNVNSRTGKGATTAGDPRAWADAMKRVENFLAAHLGDAAKQ
jgi:dienelactone hydrolase